MNLQTRQVPCESFEEQWMQGIWGGGHGHLHCQQVFPSNPCQQAHPILIFFKFEKGNSRHTVLINCWLTSMLTICRTRQMERWPDSDEVAWQQMSATAATKKSSKIGSIQDIRWQGWARRRQHMSGCMQVIWKEDRNGQSKCGLLSWSWSENIRLAGQSRPARKEHLTYTRWSGPYNMSRPKHHNS